MSDLFQNIRFAARSLRKQPSVTLIAIVCLALGIGANTAIFSVVRTVLLGDLPYRDPSRLFRLYETAQPVGMPRFLGSVSALNLHDWTEQNHSFQDFAAYDNRNMVLAGDEPERLRVILTTANAFQMLGAPAMLGRVFRSDEDRPGAPPVVLLSEGFWRRRFGGRRAVVDSTILLDGQQYLVIGVMPKDFDLPVGALRTDVWAPLDIASYPDATHRGSHWMSVIGRLKPGVRLAAAQSDMDGIAARIAHDYPDEQKDRGIAIKPLAEVVVGSARTPLLILLGAVGLVLVIACANVANLLLARATGRRRELAIRTALGADARRIIQQLFTESVMLALAGGALGLLVAWGSLRAILVLAATTLPRAGAVGLDPMVLAFTMLLSIVTGLAFGLAPALGATRLDLRENLTDGGTKASAGASHHRVLRTLVVAEIALSLMLVAGAGLLVRSFVALVNTAPGLESHGVVTFRLRVPMGPFPDSSAYRRFYGPALEALRAVPGVKAAGAINLLPLQSWGMNGGFDIIGRPKAADQSQEPFAEFRVASSGYFAALGIKVAAGRAFDDHDVATSLPVVMVNQEFVRRYFPNEDPIGKQMKAWSDAPCTIVGVASDVRQVGLDQQPRPEVYVNAAQNPARLGNMSLVVSSAGPAESVVGGVRAAIRGIARDVAIFGLESMDDVIGDSLRSRKLTLVLLGVLASLAVVLSAAGVYGVMAFTVAQRMRELGIRMALGASGTTITRMVLGDAARLAALGVGIGLAGSIALLSLLSGLVYGVGTRDPMTLVIAIVFIPVVALVASLIPAVRAARADPLVVIRAE